MILQTALQILKGEKGDWHPGNWETYRNEALVFLGNCFRGKTVYVLGVGHLFYKDFFEKGFFAKALRRILEHYQAWFESEFTLLTNAQTQTLFKLVQEKVGKPDMLRAMFEVMLGQSLEEVQAIGAEDQNSN